jgi:hypothetical protein
MLICMCCQNQSSKTNLNDAIFDILQQDGASSNLPQAHAS